MNIYKISLNTHNGLECTKFWVKAENEEEAREKAENIVDKSFWDIMDITEVNYL